MQKWKPTLALAVLPLAFATVALAGPADGVIPPEVGRHLPSPPNVDPNWFIPNDVNQRPPNVVPNADPNWFVPNEVNQRPPAAPNVDPNWFMPNVINPHAPSAPNVDPNWFVPSANCPTPPVCQ
ncbi:MAG TPA: hypothetical protein VGB83_02545 [Actinomycetota bacterium]